MPRNGSGQYTLPYNWNDDKSNGIKVLASRMQTQDQDIADALTGSIAADGQTSYTGDQNFNGNKAIDLDDGTNLQDATTIGQTQTGELQYYGISSTVTLGTDGLNYEVDASPILPEYVNGLKFNFIAHFDSLANCFMRVGTLAQLDLVKSDGNGGYVNLGNGDLQENCQYEAYYNQTIGTTKLVILNPNYPMAIGITGEIKIWSTNAAPSGFLECNGAAISRNTYANLFSVIGTTFGVGNGSTTFNIPDLRGYFPRGWDNSRGVDSGRVFGSNQTDAFQGHWHQFYLQQYDRASGGGGGTISTSPNNLAGPSDVIRQATTDGSSGSPRTAAETRPVNIALMYIIKY